MPSPLGHALGGITAGLLLARRPAVTVRESTGHDPGPGARHAGILPLFGWFAALGVLPDLDLLIGIHSRYSHSLGAVAAVVLVARYGVARGTWRGAVSWGAAYASHILLDWLGSDSTPPIGIMALWPLSAAYYQSTLSWFPAIWRTYRDGFWAHNVGAVLWEALILGPLAVAAWWWNQRNATRSPEPGGGATQAYP